MKEAKSWTALVAEYIHYRRGLGFSLKNEEKRLCAFARFAEAGHHDRLTVDLMVQWARASRLQTPITWARRLDTVRAFATYCRRVDAETAVPQCLFGSSHRRRVPHVYTQEEISALLAAADQLVPHGGLRAVTCRVVIGLLAASGLRISEALALTRSDVDLETGLLCVRESKLHRERWVPLHATVTKEMCAYAKTRDLAVPRPTSECFFLFDGGREPNQRALLYALHCLCRSLGWTPRGDYPRHRLHDLRHTFIVRSVLNAYEQNVNVHQAVLTLCTYVGHVKVADTYWYLTGIPELMQIVSDRFSEYANGGVQ